MTVADRNHTLQGLLEVSSTSHRAEIAKTAGLRKTASVDQLVEHITAPERLEQHIASLSPKARQQLTRLTFGENPYVVVHRWSPAHDDDASEELERAGLVFVFDNGWSGRYHVTGSDLVDPLRMALAAFHAGLPDEHAGAVRFVSASLQSMHDAAALAAQLRREPVRLKADGTLYQRAWPQLESALPDAPAALASPARRLEAALRFLMESGGLCPRAQRSGASGKMLRELGTSDTIETVLQLRGKAATDRLLELALKHDPFSRFGKAFVDAFAGRTLAIDDLDRSASELVNDAGMYIHGETESFGSYMLDTLVLAGLVQLGTDAGGNVVSVCFEPAPGPKSLAKPSAQSKAGPAVICQSNFDVVLLGAVSPVDSYALELCCERQESQAHTLRLTKQSVQAAAGAGVSAAATMLRLGATLPQNVERSIADWQQQVSRARLRSALFLQFDDAETCDHLMSGPLKKVAVERLGDRAVAISLSNMATVRKQLAAAGIILDGFAVDHVSGAWGEPDDHEESGLQALWGPTDSHRAWRPTGKPTSGLAPQSRPTASHAVSQRKLRGLHPALVAELEELTGWGLDR